jgi:hypothetical protein
MLLPKEKLTDIWKSGYCRAIVEFARTTEDTPAGARTRLQHISKHISEGLCEDCEFANRLKILEAEVAKFIGPSAYALFMRGGDITTLPEYERELGAVLDGAVAAGIIPARMHAWMDEVAKRKEYQP